MADKITYPVQTTGSSISAAEFNQIKTSVNGNIDDTVTAKNAADGAQNTATAAQQDIDTHEARTDNPHGVTKAQVGLSNVNNTADANKPISTATQDALNLKQDKETGKGLSTNDYTTPEKNKLAALGSQSATFAPLRTGGEINFDTSAFYNLDSDYTGTITFNFTGAIPGVETYFFYSGSQDPANITGASKRGGVFTPGQPMLIKFIYYSNSKVVYTISSNSSTASTPANYGYDALGQTFNATTGAAIVWSGIGDKIPLPANSRTSFVADIRIDNAANGGGYKISVSAPADTTNKIFQVFANTNATTFTKFAVTALDTLVPGTALGSGAASAFNVLRIFGTIATVTGGDFSINIALGGAGSGINIAMDSQIQLFRRA